MFRKFHSICTAEKKILVWYPPIYSGTRALKIGDPSLSLVGCPMCVGGAGESSLPLPELSAASRTFCRLQSLLLPPELATAATPPVVRPTRRWHRAATYPPTHPPSATIPAASRTRRWHRTAIRPTSATLPVARPTRRWHRTT